jgi:hypothetical protein
VRQDFAADCEVDVVLRELHEVLYVLQIVRADPECEPDKLLERFELVDKREVGLLVEQLLDEAADVVQETVEKLVHDEENLDALLDTPENREQTLNGGHVEVFRECLNNRLKNEFLSKFVLGKLDVL